MSRSQQGKCHKYSLDLAYCGSQVSGEERNQAAARTPCAHDAERCSAQYMLQLSPVDRRRLSAGVSAAAQLSSAAAARQPPLLSRETKPQRLAAPPPRAGSSPGRGCSSEYQAMKHMICSPENWRGRSIFPCAAGAGCGYSQGWVEIQR